jgi:hypothetical protein
VCVFNTRRCVILIGHIVLIYISGSKRILLRVGGLVARKHI